MKYTETVHSVFFFQSNYNISEYIYKKKFIVFVQSIYI